MTQGSRIIKAVDLQNGARTADKQQSAIGDSAEDALILQSEWEEPDPLDVLELDTEQVFEDSDEADEVAANTLSISDPVVDAPANVDIASDNSSGALGWLMPVLSMGAILGWTVFFGYTYQTEMIAGAPLAQWTSWISQWAIPVLLVAVAWLLFMRSSRREAQRFGATAELLSREASSLEDRLSVVNRELSLAREFLGSQTRELDSLGRMATDRISEHAGALEVLIKDNSAKLDSIANVSDTALGNMTRLRDDLPVIANSAKDVSNQIGNAGRTAEDQLGKLVAGFERVNDFGAASERQVSSFNDKVTETLDHFDAQLARLNDAADARFQTLTARSHAFRSDLDEGEAQALAAMRSRVDDLQKNVADMRETLAKDEDRALTATRDRIAHLRSESDNLSTALRDAESRAFAGLSTAKDRFYAQLKDVVEQLDMLDAHAVSSAQERVEALHAEAAVFEDRLRLRDSQFSTEMEKRQDNFAEREAEAVERIGQRLADLDNSLAERMDAQDGRGQRLAAQGEALAIQVDRLNSLFDSISGNAENAEKNLSQSLQSLKARALEGEEQVDRTGTAVSQLTEASVRLMQVLEASAAHTREEFPKAVSQAEQSLAGLEDRAVKLTATMDETASRGERLSRQVETTKEIVDTAGTEIDGLSARLNGQTQHMLQQVESMRASVVKLDKDGAALTERTRQNLSDAMTGLEHAIVAAFGAMESGTHERMRQIADDISTTAAGSIERSLSGKIEDILGRIETRASAAAGAGQVATEQLRTQLDDVSQLAANLEQRVAKAKAQSQQPTDRDFVRQMAKITESLNAHAIDITGAISNEVTDTAWEAYMKGDRGLFTRRAVKLLDSGQAREVAALYQSEEGFRATVNRYVHDFENMLGTMLSTRDGNALGVTMLGSDTGKLYVALAQAIERLRK